MAVVVFFLRTYNPRRRLRKLVDHHNQWAPDKVKDIIKMVPYLCSTFSGCLITPESCSPCKRDRRPLGFHSHRPGRESGLPCLALVFRKSRTWESSWPSWSSWPTQNSASTSYSWMDQDGNRVQLHHSQKCDHSPLSLLLLCGSSSYTWSKSLSMLKKEGGVTFRGHCKAEIHSLRRFLSCTTQTPGSVFVQK